MKLASPNQYRVLRGNYATTSIDGNNGMFKIPMKTQTLLIIVSDGTLSGWEHVSVSLKNRLPNWEEMSYVKSLFWDDEETAMQLHSPLSHYINHAKNCLLLWSPTNEILPLPPRLLV